MRVFKEGNQVLVICHTVGVRQMLWGLNGIVYENLYVRHLAKYSINVIYY